MADLGAGQCAEAEAGRCGSGELPVPGSAAPPAVLPAGLPADFLKQAASLHLLLLCHLIRFGGLWCRDPLRFIKCL